MRAARIVPPTPPSSHRIPRTRRACCRNPATGTRSVIPDKGAERPQSRDPLSSTAGLQVRGALLKCANPRTGPRWTMFRPIGPGSRSLRSLGRDDGCAFDTGRRMRAARIVPPTPPSSRRTPRRFGGVVETLRLAHASVIPAKGAGATAEPGPIEQHGRVLVSRCIAEVRQPEDRAALGDVSTNRSRLAVASAPLAGMTDVRSILAGG